MSDFPAEDYWKAIILYGLNQATYKIALGKTLIDFACLKKTNISWEELSKKFLKEYNTRLVLENPKPQQSNPHRRTVMERIILQLKNNQISENEAVSMVGENAFDDVIPRFHNLGHMDIQGLFYIFNQGKSLTLTDKFFKIVENKEQQLIQEVNSRWSMLEGAFSTYHSQGELRLENDMLTQYLANAEERKNLTDNIPFLRGYQADRCFYCAESLIDGDIHVDHVLPRKVVNHDKLWNLVLAHSFCNESKSDKLVNYYFIEKLINRNENIIGSRITRRKELILELGKNFLQRKKYIEQEYDNVKKILRNNFWGGIDSYNPETDLFYRNLITIMNNAKNS